MAGTPPPKAYQQASENMCGICGLIGGFGDQAEPAVRRMMRAMVHRGPDDEGYATQPLGSDGDGVTAAFGFRRLAILDLTTAGHQPMIDGRTGNCLVFNGEIYNFRAIRARLAASGVRFTSSGDTEVLLQALTHWGEAAIDELDGMFAFAFYEAASRRVLLARDHAGIKPLYVARLPRAIVFASEVRAILASGLVPSDLDPAGIATVLAYGAPQDPLTVHKAIRSLPSGTLQWYDAAVAEGRAPHPSRRWWRFPQIGTQAPEHALVDRIEKVCSQSVLDQCVADVPVVAFLSAGIDSALIAALAGRSGDPVVTFTVGNESSSIEDESRQAFETAEFLGTSHHQMMLDDDWVQSEWREWLASADRPCIDGLNQMVVCSAVKSAGYTVALAGLGADELFGGYWTLDVVRHERKLTAPFDVVPLPVRRAVVPMLARLAPPARRERLVELLAGGTSFLDLALRAHRMRSDDGLREMGFDHKALGLTEHWLPAEAYEPFTDVNRDLFHTVSQVDFFSYMGNRMLRDSDVYSMSRSLEMRVPFLGRRVVDLAGSIPGRQHLPPGPTRKHLLRKMAARFLPPAVLDRPKRGFNLPITNWMNGMLRDHCLGNLESFTAAVGVNRSGIEAEWRAACDAPGFASQSRRLSLVVLGSYLAHVERMPAVAPATEPSPVTPTAPGHP